MHGGGRLARPALLVAEDDDMRPAQLCLAGCRTLRSRLGGLADPYRGVVEHRAAIGQPGIGADQRVDADAPDEGGVRPDALDHDHARAAGRRRASRGSATPPALVADSARSPSASPSRAASSGWISSGRPPSRFREPGVSVKVELRKLRAGAATRRNGCSGVGRVDDRRHGPAGVGSRAWSGPIAAQSGLKWNLPSGWPKPSRKCAVSKSSAQSSQCLRVDPSGVRASRRPSGSRR